MAIEFQPFDYPADSNQAVLAKIGKTYCVLKPALEDNYQELYAPYFESPSRNEAYEVLRKVNAIED